VQLRVALAIIGLVVAVGTGGLFYLLMVLGLTPRQFTPVLSVDSDDVEMIDISCGERHRIPPRVIRDYQTRNPRLIAAISAELNSARRYWPNHPTCGNHCIVTVHTADASFPFVVNYGNCQDPEVGALIEFWSNVDWGLHLATYRSEGLDKAVGAAIVDSIETQLVN